MPRNDEQNDEFNWSDSLRKLRCDNAIKIKKNKTINSL